MAHGLAGMVLWLRLLDIPRLPERSNDRALARPLGKPEEWAAAQLADVVSWLYSNQPTPVVARQLADRARQLHNGFDDQVAIPTEHLGFARADGVTGAKIRLGMRVAAPSLRLAALPERLRGQALGQFRYRFTLDRHDGARRSPDFAEIQVAREPTPRRTTCCSQWTAPLVNERANRGKPPFPVANLRLSVVVPCGEIPYPAPACCGPVPPPEVEFRSQQLLNGLAEITQNSTRFDSG